MLRISVIENVRTYQHMHLRSAMENSAINNTTIAAGLTRSLLSRHVTENLLSKCKLMIKLN